MQRFWVFAGRTYYPGGGMTDFVGHTEDLEEAKNLADERYKENGGKMEDGFHSGWAHVFDSEEGQVFHFVGLKLSNADLEALASAVKN